MSKEEILKKLKNKTGVIVPRNYHFLEELIHYFNEIDFRDYNIITSKLNIKIIPKS